MGDKHSSPKVITNSANVNTFKDVIPEIIAKKRVANNT